MNVRLEKNVDIELYSTKAIDHVLMDGTRHVDALLAPIILSVKSQDYECWAMRYTQHYKTDVVELLAKESLKEKFSLNDDDEVEITFFEQKRKKKEIPGVGVLKKLYGIQPQLRV
jgi:CTP-dependent riboflavin kinase